MPRGAGSVRRDRRAGSDHFMRASNSFVRLISTADICSKSFAASTSSTDEDCRASNSSMALPSSCRVRMLAFRASSTRRAPGAEIRSRAGIGACGRRDASALLNNSGSRQNASKAWSKSGRCPGCVTRVAKSADRTSSRRVRPVASTARRASTMCPLPKGKPARRSVRAKWTMLSAIVPIAYSAASRARLSRRSSSASRNFARSS